MTDPVPHAQRQKAESDELAALRAENAALREALDKEKSAHDATYGQMFQLREALQTAHGNIASLMNAYPDLYPRYAFQNIYDLLGAALASEGEKG